MITKLENLMRNSKVLQKISYTIPGPFMGIILNLRAIPLVKMRYSKKTFEYLDKLMERDEWTYEELAEFVEEQKKNIKKIAHEIPYYKDIAIKVSFISDFPILTREEVKNNYNLMINPQKKSLIRVFTSGSSGSGLPIYYDKQAYLLFWAYQMKQKLWACVDPREWRISFFGARIISLDKDKPPFWIKNQLERQYLMSIFHISDKNAECYVRFLEKNQGLVIEGFPSVLYLIAQYVKALKGKLEFKAVFTTGEPLYPFMRKEIEDVFSSKVYDSYGMTELGGFIVQCDKGGYHVLVDYGYLEILKESGEPAQINEEGYLVWTGFINSAMPFIRYKIGDKGIWGEEKCTCGRPYPIVKTTITRDSDYIITPSGKILSPRAVNQVLKNKVSFKSCQFIQKKSSELIVRVVPELSKDFKKELKELLRSLKKIVGEEVYIIEEIADEPVRRGTQGKIPLIISKIKNENINGKRIRG